MSGSQKDPGASAKDVEQVMTAMSRCNDSHGCLALKCRACCAHIALDKTLCLWTGCCRRSSAPSFEALVPVPFERGRLHTGPDTHFRRERQHKRHMESRRVRRILSCAESGHSSLKSYPHASGSRKTTCKCRQQHRSHSRPRERLLLERPDTGWSTRQNRRPSRLHCASQYRMMYRTGACLQAFTAPRSRVKMLAGYSQSSLICVQSCMPHTGKYSAAARLKKLTSLPSPLRSPSAASRQPMMSGKTMV